MVRNWLKLTAAAAMPPKPMFTSTLTPPGTLRLLKRTFSPWFEFPAAGSAAKFGNPAKLAAYVPGCTFRNVYVPVESVVASALTAVPWVVVPVKLTLTPWMPKSPEL